MTVKHSSTQNCKRFLRSIRDNPVIASLAPEQPLDLIRDSRASAVILQHGSLQTLAAQVDAVHANGQFALVEVDRLEGLKTDTSGIRFMQDHGVDAVITTKTNVIGLAARFGLIGILRCFIMDTQSRDKSVELAEQLQPPVMEIMPAAVVRDVCSGLRRRKVEVPVIASGLLNTMEQVHRVLEAGATAVSASCPELWRNPSE